MSVAVAQLGARRHYLVPRAFNEAGMLERFFTDICGIAGWPALLGALPSWLQSDSMLRLASRIPGGIRRSQITTFPVFGLRYRWRCRKARNSSQLSDAWLWGGRRFCNLVGRRGFAGATAVYAFNSAALELFEVAQDLGLTTILDQSIAPRLVERKILDEEMQRWPGWEPAPQPGAETDEYCRREQQEWKIADLIVCGSEFVRDGIGSCGGPVDRCRVVPFAADQTFAMNELPPRQGPLRILFVGRVCLRKGVQYILEAAKRTKGKAIYRLVGPIGVTPVAEMELRRHIELTGSVLRSQMIEHYRWADVLVLPSLCEGSANVTYEALAAGVPVICTPNAGSIVRDGVDGFVIPAQSVEEMQERIEFLYGNRLVLRQMACEGAAHSANYSALQSYSDRLVAVVENCKNTRAPV